MPYWQINFSENGVVRGSGSFDFIPPPNQLDGTIPWRSQGMRSYSFTFNLPPPFNPIQFTNFTVAGVQAGFVTYNAQGKEVTAVTAQLTVYDNSGYLTTLRFQKEGKGKKCTWNLSNGGDPYHGIFGLMLVPAE